MQGIKTPISKVAAALRLRGEGMGLRATARILGTHKNTCIFHANWTAVPRQSGQSERSDARG